jgi:anaerobic selenocysteine-containing dehydrogenase
MSEEIVTSICGICPGGCGVNVKLVDGKIEKISPIKGHPVGEVCVRGGSFEGDRLFQRPFKASTASRG